MATPWSITLYDLPQFEGLKAVGAAFGVRFRLFGGAASRLAMSLVHRPGIWPSLVELSPFSSDIDLQHSGDDALSPAIQTAIEALVPEAAWCRWSLLGAQSGVQVAAHRSQHEYTGPQDRLRLLARGGGRRPGPGRHPVPAHHPVAQQCVR